MDKLEELKRCDTNVLRAVYAMHEELKRCDINVLRAVCAMHEVIKSLLEAETSKDSSNYNLHFNSENIEDSELGEKANG